MQVVDFLKAVITAKEGWFCLAIGDGKTWLEEWKRWPNDLDEIVELIQKNGETFNVYFSSYLFKAPSSIKDNVLPTRTVQADLDHAAIETLPIKPSVLVQTSPGRHQAFWTLSEELDPETHEALSRKLTYSIELCDHSGWPLGRKVRVPGTKNFKYLDGPKPVVVREFTGKIYTPSEFELLPDVPSYMVAHYSDDFLANPETCSTGPQTLLASVKDKLPAKVYNEYSIAKADRSTALWALEQAAFRAGLDRAQVFKLSKHSANNKFADLRFHGNRELAKDVLRAEQVVRANITDERALITELRKTSGPPLDRKQALAATIIELMKSQGEFIHTAYGLPYYVRRDLGRPVSISRHSEYLDMLLNLQFGLNAVEIDTGYVVASLEAYVRSLPPNGDVASMSHYNPNTQTILLHTGRKDVISITPNAITTIIDGSCGVIFPWYSAVEEVKPQLDSTVDWGEELFGSGTRGFGSTLESVEVFEPGAIMALLKVWTIFLIIRNISVSRPILATFGQPGSGKSTLFRKIYTFLYGRQKSLSAVTDPTSFDFTVAADPLVVLDNVDTWERWLPDRLALSASTSDIQKRRLYTDNDLVTIKRQALIGITAHNPKFGREDVADRLLLITMRRLDNFISESLILDDIARKRNYIWGALIRDLQRLLQTPMPVITIQFRVEDFARIGTWIAVALGVQREFEDAIAVVNRGQRAFVLGEEAVIVSAIQKMITRDNGTTVERTAAQLWPLLELYSGDANAFDRTYKNSVTLSKKLWSLHTALQQVFNIDSVWNPTKGTRTWKFHSKKDI